jgi:hypothetical protein
MSQNQTSLQFQIIPRSADEVTPFQASMIQNQAQQQQLIEEEHVRRQYVDINHEINNLQDIGDFIDNHAFESHRILVCGLDRQFQSIKMATDIHQAFQANRIISDPSDISNQIETALGIFDPTNGTYIDDKTLYNHSGRFSVIIHLQYRYVFDIAATFPNNFVPMAFSRVSMDKDTAQFYYALNDEIKFDVAQHPLTQPHNSPHPSFRSTTDPMFSPIGAAIECLRIQKFV